ncbi:MAG: Ig-like domain-containing protein, partial [Candidatus Micrarchaeia archaeon]
MVAMLIEGASKSSRAQSALEYLVTYGWAILLVTIVMALLYLYLFVPKVIVPASCSFTSGAYCNDLVVGTNATTHATKLAVFLTNTQPYPVQNPYLYVRVNNQNSSQYQCTPKFVPPGGAIICEVDVPVSTSLGSFVVGQFYLGAQYCGLAPNYTSTHICANAPNEIYEGNFNAHAAPLISTTSKIQLTTPNQTNPANNAKAPLYATVLLLGYPLKGAAVNFTENNSAYTLQPNLTTTNTQGVALSYISGTEIGSVNVTAHYAGYYSSIVINFAPPLKISFNIKGYLYCLSTSSITKIDGVSYSCSQLSSTTFNWGLGSVHTYNFTPTAIISPYAREVFKNLTANGVTYTNPNGTLTVSKNTTINVNYVTQYYLSEIANPSSAGSVQ